MFLPRYLVVWSDGVSLVIHAQHLGDAHALARSLVAPQGAHVVRVEEVR